MSTVPVVCTQTHTPRSAAKDRPFEVSPARSHYWQTMKRITTSFKCTHCHVSYTEAWAIKSVNEAGIVECSRHQWGQMWSLTSSAASYVVSISEHPVVGVGWRPHTGTLQRARNKAQGYEQMGLCFLSKGKTTHTSVCSQAKYFYTRSLAMGAADSSRDPWRDWGRVFH